MTVKEPSVPGLRRWIPHQKVLEVREPSWWRNPLPRKETKGASNRMGRAEREHHLKGWPWFSLLVPGARLHPHLGAFRFTQCGSGEETSQISGALQGFGMHASEEFEHQKVQRWLEKSSCQIVGSKTRLLCPIFDFSSDDRWY